MRTKAEKRYDWGTDVLSSLRCAKTIQERIVDLGVAESDRELLGMLGRMVEAKERDLGLHRAMICDGVCLCGKPCTRNAMHPPGCACDRKVCLQDE